MSVDTRTAPITGAPPAPRQMLHALFEEAITAISAERTMPTRFPVLPAPGRTVLIALGKAAAEMAAVASQRLPGPLSGLVITRAGHGVDAGRLPRKRWRSLRRSSPVSGC
jgi:glycerate-2-kinase